jgi:hypothetical protein
MHTAKSLLKPNKYDPFSKLNSDVYTADAVGVNLSND